MPHKDKNSTLIRQWEMLRLLSSTYWMKASEIAARLKDEDYDVSVRTVQRDLKELSSIFPIALNDKNPRDYGWKWMKDAHLAIPGMSLPEALAMRLVEMHLKQMMPSSMLDALQGVFSYAKTRLEKEEIQNKRTPSEWLEKVKVIQPSQPLLPPQINEAAQNAIYNALLKNRRVNAAYKPAWSEESNEIVLSPLGLIMRGQITYLVAAAWEYADFRLYAMHRFVSAEVLDQECNVPQGFDLDKAVSSGFGDFQNSADPIRLELLCEVSSANYLEETPLSTDQTISPERDGWVRVSATVNDTWQLRWWLLSQGSSIEVLSPEILRKNIAEELQKASRNYADKSERELLETARGAAERLKAITDKVPPRDPARIPVMLEAVRKKWEKDTDLRLSQLIVNAISPSEPCPQVYYFEDDELLSRLR